MRQPLPRQEIEPESSPERRRPVEERLGVPAGATAPGLTHDLPTLMQWHSQVGNRWIQRAVSRATSAGTGTPEGGARRRGGLAEIVSLSSLGRALQQARGRGRALPREVQGRMEAAFGTDFAGVRVHTGAGADGLNRALNARAFTWGNDVFFRAGEYRPGSSTGQQLLAHELTHVVQQAGPLPRPLHPRTRSAGLGRPDDGYEQEAHRVERAMALSPQPAAPDAGGELRVQGRSTYGRIQRDLIAYNKEKTEVLPSFGGPDGGGSTTLITTSADAPGIRAALAALIAAGKVKEVQSASGNASWFAANHHKNANLAEIEQAFTAAGYSLAAKMARSLYDIHGEYLYASEKLTVVGLFTDYTRSTGPRVTTKRTRSMTEYEIRQARRVFKDALDYSKVTIADGSLGARIGSVGGYARTIGNTVYFPTGSSRSMAFMIHELTHAWQYQKTGWTYAVKALWAQVAEGYSYTPEGKTPDEALREARTAGSTLYDYNKEQQGDILADYFRRLQSGGNVSAYQPFVDDVR